MEELILFPRFHFSPTKVSFSPDLPHLFLTFYVPMMPGYLSQSWPAACIAWPGAAMAVLVSIN